MVSLARCSIHRPLRSADLDQSVTAVGSSFFRAAGTTIIAATTRTPPLPPQKFCKINIRTIRRIDATSICSAPFVNADCCDDQRLLAAPAEAPCEVYVVESPAHRTFQAYPSSLFFCKEVRSLQYFEFDPCKGGKIK